VHPTGQRQHVQATVQAADDAQTHRSVVAGMVIAPGPADTSHFAGDNSLPLHMLLLLLSLMRMMILMMTDVVVVTMAIPTTTSSMYIDIVRVVAIHRHEVIAVVLLLLQ
jgi:hypothetical protein